MINSLMNGGNQDSINSQGVTYYPLLLFLFIFVISIIVYYSYNLFNISGICSNLLCAICCGMIIMGLTTINMVATWCFVIILVICSCVGMVGLVINGGKINLIQNTTIVTNAPIVPNVIKST